MHSHENVILIGFMGSGKTSTGKELAPLLQYGFWDIDQWIEEKMKKKIHELFHDEGELFFREKEKEAIHWFDGKKKYVISTGGGIWINEENRKQLLDKGLCVWLKVSPQQALNRIVHSLSQRPLLAREPDPLKVIEKMMEERNVFYSQAHISINTDGKQPKEVALEIQKILNNQKNCWEIN